MLALHRKAATLSSRSFLISASRSLSSEVVSASPSTSTPPPIAQAEPSSPEEVKEPAKAVQETKATNSAHKRRYPTRRPRFSLEHPRKWNRALRAGFLPAYDEALKLIRQDTLALTQEAAELRRRIKKTEAEISSVDPTHLAEDKKKLEILEIQSEINLPSIRWKFANGMGDMTKPVNRHLAEQRWRNMGDLDLLMERIHQMNVVPDLLPSLHPSFDLRITFPQPNAVSKVGRSKRTYTVVEPGSFLLPEQTRRPPRIYATVFHPELRYYTMVMVDPDVPDPDNQTYTSYLHWMQPNIALSATSKYPITFHPHTPYIPPHPQNGSPYHRYSLFLLPHPNPSEKLDVPVVPNAERRGFDLRAFCDLHGFDASKGGAAHMWREVWDRTVSQIYRDNLKLPEPKYSHPPKIDRYEEVKQMKKYLL